uniref:hypothetical protein n=1 Tax=Helicobacter japonicus TaxID=425400 RepID=UPI002631A83A
KTTGFCVIFLVIVAQPLQWGNMNKKTKEHLFLLSSLMLICIMAFASIYFQNSYLAYIFAPVPIIIALMMYLYTKQKTYCPHCHKSFKLEFIGNDISSQSALSYCKKDVDDMLDGEIFHVEEKTDYFKCRHCGFINFEIKKYKVK